MKSYTQLLDRLISEAAVIYPGEFSDLYAAYPHGDRRRRPVCWLNDIQFKSLRADGVINLKSGGYHIAYSFIRRQKSALQDKAHAAQHRDFVDRDIYTPDRVKRQARFNTNSSPLRRLARIKDGAGQPLLTTAEIEAGERFASDYHFSALGTLATQNYMSTGSGTTYSGDQDTLSVQKLDARNRVMSVIGELGGGLDRAVIAVCVNELTLERLEQTENWVKKSGRTILKLGLQRLVKFYGTDTSGFAARG